MNNPLALPAAWAAALCEPLISTRRRADLDAAMRQRATESPRWAVIFFAGMVSDQIQTLPAEDPWRHLSARAGDLTRCDVPRPPDSTGAVSGGDVFGQPSQGEDLVDLSPGDPGAEVTSAALADGLEPPAAAVLAFAADGWRAAAGALEEVLAQGHEVFEIGADALRWAVWRRRAYVGADDDLTMLSAMQWAWRAQALSEGGALDLAESETTMIATTLADYAVAAGEYERYRLR
ncbi:hypothetical protein CHO01_28910 [Cellulomonas hominis]|uniref:Uncharacterized protein n=1 Tax=Cellulomonas hominis TaxID=156981 RepID=A0A511FEU4_9CELL|nr:hypothetical protein [Cellulomonas hominis]MBB5474758.1 hypothetical protein [Cellulomonas hominis]NKY05414.1 hypothetical protein [Cellulomonas hominis]GEL47775.1 hypothetical protein CHO01_28910 [Cellulomonas hominis]